MPPQREIGLHTLTRGPGHNPKIVPTVDLQSELVRAEKAAREAGQWLCVQKELFITDSTGKDVKTRADVQAQALIESRLTESRIPILGEESVESHFLDRGSLPWIVDPLDGTANHARRIPFSAVSIALWQGDTALLGVVYDFLRDELYSAATRQGAFLNSERIHVTNIKDPSAGIVMSGFPLGFEAGGETVGDFAAALYSFKKVRMIGSAALSLCYVAAGRADLYAENGIALWDVAAGLALVQEAGGFFSMARTSVPLLFKVRAGSSRELVRGWNV